MSARNRIEIKLETKPDSPNELGLDELREISEILVGCVNGCSRAVTQDKTPIRCPVKSLEHGSFIIAFAPTSETLEKRILRKIEDVFLQTIFPDTRPRRRVGQFDEKARDWLAKFGEMAESLIVRLNSRTVDPATLSRFQPQTETTYSSVGSIQGTVSRILAHSEFFVYISPETQAEDVRCRINDPEIKKEIGGLHKRVVRCAGTKQIVSSTGVVKSMEVTDIERVKKADTSARNAFLDLLGTVEDIDEEIRLLRESRDEWDR